MTQKWDDDVPESYKRYTHAAERGPAAIFTKILMLFAGLAIIGTVLMFFVFRPLYLFNRVANEAGDVAVEEFGPQAALAKYEEFVKMANQIERARKNADLMDAEIKKIEDEFVDLNGGDKTQWNQVTKVMYSERAKTARENVQAAKLVANDLIQQYKQESAKFNWAPFKSKEGCPPEDYDIYIVQ